MKRILALLLASMMLVGTLAGCGGGNKETTAPETGTPSTTAPEGGSGEATTITLWTYPIGSWGDQDTLDQIIANFNAVYPDIKVEVQLLDYTSGDDTVTSAIAAGTTPDIVMEGPERLVSNWGAAGKMVDLSDLWDDDTVADISAVSEAVVNACKGTDGAYYEYPLCMTTHCMAINYEVFEAADALQYIDQETRTWTTENFLKAIEAVAASGQLSGPVGVVYCGGQGGDQGTRALVNNLYSGTYTNADHTAYTADSEENIKALQLLVDQVNAGTLGSDAGIVAADELQLFANGTIGMTFAWNASNKANYASQVSFTPYAMAFPSDDGVPELCGGIWGFGIFDNGDDAKIEAAKTFIKFVCDDATQGPASVQATGFFPVRSSFGDVYAGTEQEESMAEFSSLMAYLGDYYNVTGGWTEQRAAWYTMLQQIFSGTDVTTAATTFVETSNAAIK